METANTPAIMDAFRWRTSDLLVLEVDGTPNERREARAELDRREQARREDSQHFGRGGSAD